MSKPVAHSIGRSENPEMLQTLLYWGSYRGANWKVRHMLGPPFSLFHHFLCLSLLFPSRHAFPYGPLQCPHRKGPLAMSGGGLQLQSLLRSLLQL